jgi:hypothetical protein
MPQRSISVAQVCAYAASRTMPHCACGAALGGLAMLIDTA